jgi:hypothetical protein
MRILEIRRFLHEAASGISWDHGNEVFRETASSGRSHGTGRWKICDSLSRSRASQGKQRIAQRRHFYLAVRGTLCPVAAKLYTTKMPITGADLLNDRVLPFSTSQEMGVIRILTDRGTEYRGKPEPTVRSSLTPHVR